MEDREPTSVLLPTTQWTTACDEVAAQLNSADELLVIADHPSDPVASRREDPPAGVRLVYAGEPDGCSGKANAIAAGMEAARHDRVVWTDDDFHHPPDWLAELNRAYDRHGPVSEVPVFVGRDPLALLLEPAYALGGTLGVYAAGKAWAGAVCFERDDLDVDRFFADLRRTVSDDGLLSEVLDVTPLRRTRRVDIGGSIRDTLERHVRFTQIVSHHAPRGALAWSLLWVAVAVGCLLFPLVGVVLTTPAVGGVYAFFGVRRWTVVLAAPAIVCQVPLALYGRLRRTFVWGGRRYRWDDTFDVTIVE